MKVHNSCVYDVTFKLKTTMKQKSPCMHLLTMCGLKEISSDKNLFQDV